jgi:hypothetical protein
MKRTDDIDDPRRRLLIQALATGVFAAGLPGSNALAASIFGSQPSKIPSNQSIYRISGEATVNGKVATLETRIKPGDTVKTAKDSEIIFVVNGNNSMILRGDSHLVLETEQKKAEAKKVESKKDERKKIEPAIVQPETSFITGLKLFAGKLLSVSRNSPMQVRTTTATIGIRGTGFYVTSAPEETYFCTCYGLTDVVSNFNPNSKETIQAEHHDKPVYIVKDAQGNNIRKAPLIDHTDQELTLIETLVGRTTPFVFANDAYSAPRRDY